MKERKRTAQNDRAPRPPMPARVTQQKNWPAGCSKSPDFSPTHPKLPRQLVLRVGYVEDAFEGASGWLKTIIQQGRRGEITGGVPSRVR
jgi:hypothetical protein